MVLWELPGKLSKSKHKFKYRLYYGTADGVCLVRYDNEQGKGDHRHIGDRKEAYKFRDVENLVRDFLTDIDKIQGGHNEKTD